MLGCFTWCTAKKLFSLFISLSQAAMLMPVSSSTKFRTWPTSEISSEYTYKYIQIQHAQIQILESHSIQSLTCFKRSITAVSTLSLAFCVSANKITQIYMFIWRAALSFSNKTKVNRLLLPESNPCHLTTQEQQFNQNTYQITHQWHLQTICKVVKHYFLLFK